MAIAVRSQSVTSNEIGGTTIVNKPTGTVQNDVMLTCFVAGATTLSITTLAGWTVLVPDTVNATSQIEVAIYLKVAGASEPSTYTWTTTTAHSVSARSITYTGVDTVNPIDATSPAPSLTTNTASPTSPSITTVTNDAWLIGMCLDNSSDPTSSVWTIDTTGSIASVGFAEVGHIDQAVAGASGTKAWTIAKSGCYCTMSALRPTVAAAATIPNVNMAPSRPA